MTPPTRGPRRGRPNPDELEEWLKPSATISERVHGLLEIGLHASDIAKTTGVSVSALRNWSTGQARPRPDASIALDDLRASARILLEGGMHPDRIAQWLAGWNPKIEGRPLDIIGTRPMDVRAAAHGEVFAAVLTTV
jgi:hypothetical protein